MRYARPQGARVRRAKTSGPPLKNAALAGTLYARALARSTNMINGVSQPSRQAPLVLVVDDFEDNRAMYAAYLTHSGYRVEQASNGEEAVEITRRLKPDVVVMDLSLPIMDGWEATRQLKAGEGTRHIPVIALTGHALAGHSRVAREAGCDAFLAKPCLPEKLVAKLEELMGA
jgi:two-component system, cell cycle response regulator DivK